MFYILYTYILLATTQRNQQSLKDYIPRHDAVIKFFTNLEKATYIVQIIKCFFKYIALTNDH